MIQPQPQPTTSDSPVALVTGAGRRVGLGIARALAARGYRMALHAGRSRSEVEAFADELSALGVEALALAADLRDEEATRKMIAAAHDHFGRIDALVNSAAIWISKPLEEVRADDVRQHFEVNMLATFVCCQAVGLIMVQQPTGGAIVNIGDWAVVRPYRDYAAYFPSKGAIPTLTRTFALELGTRNPRVRCNAVLPGPVLFPAEMTAEDRQAVVDATLARREGTVEDLAQAIVCLLENTFITGVSLPVDGGRSIFCPPTVH